ncbi:hypothetical protein EUTSA_v10012139mg [Eutrema salsugineum]|uniref:EF-hand domain-containing protein n=1 Tax=Eutrema salsugineum TaxID=72664 RepID=V4MGX7_EUTSA|nr:hypothetical protein EUTSA_v10012139mg [Eutrema salsugineum]
MSAKQIFEKFDKNKNGKLSLDEFCEAALAFSKNISQEEIVKMFKEIDVDGDGELDAVEFTSSFEKILKETFAFCDADGDGKITSKEFHAAMIGLGKDWTEEKCAEMVQAADGFNGYNAIN